MAPAPAAVAEKAAEATDTPASETPVIELVMGASIEKSKSQKGSKASAAGCFVYLAPKDSSVSPRISSNR